MTTHTCAHPRCNRGVAAGTFACRGHRPVAGTSCGDGCCVPVVRRTDPHHQRSHHMTDRMHVTSALSTSAQCWRCGGQITWPDGLTVGHPAIAAWLNNHGCTAQADAPQRKVVSRVAFWAAFAVGAITGALVGWKVTR